MILVMKDFSRVGVLETDMVAALFELSQNGEMPFQGLDVAFAIPNQDFGFAVPLDFSGCLAVGAGLVGAFAIDFELKDGPVVTGRTFVAKKHYPCLLSIKFCPIMQGGRVARKAPGVEFNRNQPRVIPENRLRAMPGAVGT
jgi:hypothetical protein